MRYGRFVGIIGLTLIIIFALAIRLFPVLNSPEKLRGGLGPFGDSFLYSLLASNLSEAKGFVTDKGKAAFTRGPGYPLFMSIIYKFFGRSGDTFAVSWDKVRIAQCILDTACCLLVFCIVWLIYPECIVFALVSAALYSLSFYNIYYTRVLLSETLTTFLVTLFILMAILSLIRKQIRWFFYSGVSLGFIVLCRPEYLLFILVFTLFLLTLKHRFSKVVLYLLGVCIIVLPWSVRNFLVFKKPVLISTGGLAEGLYTATFYNSANWKGWGAFPDSVFLNAEEKEIANSLHAIYPRVLYSGSIDEVVGIEKAYFKLALKRVQRQPLAVFRNWLVKIPRLWFQDYIQMYRDREASGLFFIFYFSFGLYGFFSATAEKRILMNPLCLLFIYLNLLFIPLHIEPRYGVALMPGLVSLAGIGLGKFLRLNSLPFCKRGVV